VSEASGVYLKERKALRGRATQVGGKPHSVKRPASPNSLGFDRDTLSSSRQTPKSRCISLEPSLLSQG